MTTPLFDPEQYTISIQKVLEDGEYVYVAKIEELPDLFEFADSPEFARELALDAITTAYELCTENGIDFPRPKFAELDGVNGRITLRLPKSLHVKCISLAKADAISLNSFIIGCIERYSTIYQETKQIVSTLVRLEDKVTELTEQKKYEIHRTAYSNTDQFTLMQEMGRRVMSARIGDEPSNTHYGLSGVTVNPMFSELV